MEDKLLISLPHKCGYIDRQTCQGILTVIVHDKEKKPVTGLVSDNFHFYYQTKFVDELTVQEHDAGMYMLQFSFERQLGTDDKRDGMVMVKRQEQYSNTLLVPFY